MEQPSAMVKDRRICVLLHESKVKSGRGLASETVASVFHMELMLTPSAHMNARKSNIRVSVKYRERRSTHRIASHRIESHHIASYRIATAPGAIAESRPLFLPFTMFTYKVARRRKSFQFSLAVCLVTGRFPRSRASTPRRFSKSAVFVFEMSALSDGRLLGNNFSPLIAARWISSVDLCAK
jgi:hypothetical protein